MGSSVSVQKDPESVMKFQSPIGSNTKNPSVNQEDHVVDMDFKAKSSLPPRFTSFQTLGSKEETFFDSQTWLDSDCDDDFQSVNGELTPSRNSASDPKSNTIGTPQLQQSLLMCGTLESRVDSSPTDKKMRLSELLHESFVGDEDPESNEQNMGNGNAKVDVRQTNLDLPPKTKKRSPFVRGLHYLCSSERSPSRHSKPEKEQSTKSAHCCLPTLFTSRGFSKRKKKLSPDRSGL